MGSEYEMQYYRPDIGSTVVRVVDQGQGLLIEWILHDDGLVGLVLQDEYIPYHGNEELHFLFNGEGFDPRELVDLLWFGSAASEPPRAAILKVPHMGVVSA